jgi:ribonuclease Z
MKSFFSFHFYNSPFDDSLLCASQLNSKEDLLFDLGNFSHVPTSVALRIKYIFISHTHLDHFAGFPAFLRQVLKNSGAHIHLFGPEGFIKNMQGALNAYTWNLLENYQLTFEVTEIQEKKLLKTQFLAGNQFQHNTVLELEPLNGILVENDIFRVHCRIMDHKTPVIGYRLEEKNRFSVNKQALDLDQIPVGPWISEVKKIILNKGDLATKINTGTKNLSGQEIISRYFILQQMPSYAYITDIGFSRENFSKAVWLASGVKTLFIESNFLHLERQSAHDTCHLTAYQAGIIAGKAGAQKVRLFHVSQRYFNHPEIKLQDFYQEMEKGKNCFSPLKIAE